MADAYTPSINDGQTMARAELDLIASASAKLEARILVNEGRPAYSGMRIDTPKAVSLSTTPLEITGWDAPTSRAAERGISRDVAAGTLTVADDGVYILDLVLYLTGVGNGVTFTVDVYVNHLSAGAIPGTSPGLFADQINLSVYSQPVSLSAGDLVSVYLSADQSDNPSIGRAMMRMLRVG